MNSSRPYIIRAIYEWIVDNGCTPHLLVDVDHDGIDVPQSYVTDGQIVLNISPNAVVGLEMGNDLILFNGRFGGVATDIVVPIGAILGIYARENGQGHRSRQWAEAGPASRWLNSRRRNQFEQLYNPPRTSDLRRYQRYALSFLLVQETHQVDNAVFRHDFDPGAGCVRAR